MLPVVVLDAVGYRAEQAVGVRHVEAHDWYVAALDLHALAVHEAWEIVRIMASIPTGRRGQAARLNLGALVVEPAAPTAWASLVAERCQSWSVV